MSIKTFQADIKAREGLIISTDTLRTADLLSAAYMTITTYKLKTAITAEIKKVFTEDPTAINLFYNRTRIKHAYIENADCLWNEDIFYYFNRIAPDGYYFGNTEGDGACIGFFKADNESL